MLSNRRPANVPSRISQEMSLRRQVVDINAPPALALSVQNSAQVSQPAVMLEHLCFKRLQQECNYRVIPDAHYCIFVDAQRGNPTTVRTSQSPRRNQDMEMCIEIQVPSKRMRHHYHLHANTVHDLEP